MACNADMIVQSQEGGVYGFLYGGSISIGGVIIKESTVSITVRGT